MSRGVQKDREEFVAAVAAACDLTGMAPPSTKTSTKRLLEKANKAAATLTAKDLDLDQDFEAGYAGISPSDAKTLIQNGVAVPEEWVEALDMKKAKGPSKAPSTAPSKKAAKVKDPVKIKAKAEAKIKAKIKAKDTKPPKAPKAPKVPKPPKAPVGAVRSGTRMEGVGRMLAGTTVKQIKEYSKEQVLDLTKRINDEGIAAGMKDNLGESMFYARYAIQFLQGFLLLQGFFLEE